MEQQKKPRGGKHPHITVRAASVANEFSNEPIDQGTIPVKVAREVIAHLSLGLYRNFARAIRELVSNAYDAKAMQVRIGLDFKSDPAKVIVRDDGLGMTVAEMESRLFRIGTVTPPTEDIDVDTGR